MKNSLMLKVLAVLFVLTIFVGCSSKKSRPNIILILTDDQGYADVSAHGSPDVLTPNMDKLKSQGISLEDFQVSPTCAPTRSAIMTGRHPFKNGITHTILERERMAPGITILPEVLKKGGYTTAVFGKWHLGDEDEYQPDSRGFDEVFIHGAGGIGQAYPGSCADVPDNNYFNPVIKHNGTFVQTSGFCTDVFFAQALSWIKTKSDEDKPFFAYIATNAPHGPYLAPEEYKEKFKNLNYSPGAQGYYGMIENIDDNLGVLMQKLNDWNLTDNTILIFMSDNGKALHRNKEDAQESYNAGMRGYKGSPYEGGTRVPFFIRWPGKFSAGKKVDVLLNHYDILPTLAEITDIDISDIPDMDGQSFLPYLKGEKVEAEDRYRFVHTGRWPLNPENVAGQEIRERWVGTAETSDPENSKFNSCAVRNEQYRFVNNKELFDLLNDPGEIKNVASEHPEVVTRMREAYDQWWNNVKPYMVNEKAPLAGEKPFWTEYKKQKESTGLKALDHA